MGGYRDIDDYKIGSEFYKELYSKKGDPNFRKYYHECVDSRKYKKIMDDSDFPPYSDFCQLIICAPTNIWIDCQVGGHACRHPCVEGFVIDCPKYWVGIDDCKMGCYFINDEYKDLQLKVSNNIQKDFEYVQSKLTPEILSTLSPNENMKLNFDYERLDELQEAWWPVLVDWNGQNGLKGYLTGWNCD